MARRLQLHEELCKILGTRNVYFQPPESVKLKYDCIVYSVNNREDLRADDIHYRNLVRYEVILMYRDPDSELPEALLNGFTRISHQRHFTSDNVHHDVYTLFY